MADMKQIGGYEAMIMQIGYIFSEEVPMDIWEVAADHVVGSQLTTMLLLNNHERAFCLGNA